jgi:hypothetical protein
MNTTHYSHNQYVAQVRGTYVALATALMLRPHPFVSYEGVRYDARLVLDELENEMKKHEGLCAKIADRLNLSSIPREKMESVHKIQRAFGMSISPDGQHGDITLIEKVA